MYFFHFVLRTPFLGVFSVTSSIRSFAAEIGISGTCKTVTCSLLSSPKPPSRLLTPNKTFKTIIPSFLPLCSCALFLKKRGLFSWNDDKNATTSENANCLQLRKNWRPYKIQRDVCTKLPFFPLVLTRSSMGQIKIQAPKIFEASAVIQPLRQAVKNEIKMNAQKLWAECFLT